MCHVPPTAPPLALFFLGLLSMSGDFFGTPSRRVRGQPRTPDGLPDSEVDNPPERRSSPRFAPKYVVQRRRWRQAHIQEAATTDEKRKAKKLLKNVDEVAPEIADGWAIALERIVDIIDERYRQEAIKKAITARQRQVSQDLAAACSNSER